MVKFIGGGGDFFMKFIFQCGACGHKYTVNTKRVNDLSFGNYCPNCEECVPPKVKQMARNVLNLDSTIGTENWKLFAIPDELIKDELLWTESKE